MKMADDGTIVDSLLLRMLMGKINFALRKVNENIGSSVRGVSCYDVNGIDMFRYFRYCGERRG